MLHLSLLCLLVAAIAASLTLGRPPGPGSDVAVGLAQLFLALGLLCGGLGLARRR